MPYNPSPEVAVARDAAGKLGEIIGAPVKQIVVLYLAEDNRLGYASYGKDKANCAGARMLGDAAYEEGKRYLR